MFQREIYGGDFRILTTNGVGTRTRRLTRLTSASALPRWGPQGHRILYVRTASNGSAAADVMVMGARGRHKRVLLPGRGSNFVRDLAWAPDARRVVLVMMRDGVSDLWMLTTATGSLRRLHVEHFPERIVQSVDWSRMGDIVVSATDFRDEAQEDTDLFLVRPDGSGLRQITDTPNRPEDAPRFSPDGRRLVYGSRSGSCGFLVVSNSDGTSPRRVPGVCDAWHASWSPDSRRLLAQRLNGRRLRDEIWSMTVDGGSRHFIAAGAYASWRPRPRPR